MRLLLVLLLLLLLPLPLWAATVTRVIDADTLVLDDALKVRLYGIGSPERGQPGEQEATEYAVKLVLGQHVEIEEQYQDRYRRTIAIVTLENGSTLQGQQAGAKFAEKHCAVIV